MFSVKQDKDILGAFCFFWIIAMIMHLCVLLIRDVSSAHGLRFFAAIPFGLYGGIALEAFDAWRKGGGTELPEFKNYSIGFAFHGIFGIFLFLWAFFSFVAGIKVENAAPPGGLKNGSGYRSRFLFYLVVIELFFVGTIVTATALSYSYVPMGYAGCRRKRLIGTDLAAISRISDVYAVRLCVRTVTTQILAIMSAILSMCHAVALVPFMGYPRSVRYILYMIFHNTTSGNRAQVKGPNKQKKTYSEIYVLDKLDHPEQSAESGPLYKLLASDAVAERIAQHLHFADVSNLARSSRMMRDAIRNGNGHDREERLQLFCEATCLGGEKGECWACARQICKACRYERSGIPEPRTTTHATGCFAVCTKCYFLRAAAQPAPWQATKHTDDLEVQHSDCWTKCGERKTLEKDVALCRSCDLLPRNEDVSSVREKRDGEALRRAHGGRLWCAECQKSLGKGRRRWFICEKGRHECHWQGHQLC